ncbi:MAG: hypothetical protein NVS2B16_24870 [Chloroflexota bacterium]
MSAPSQDDFGRMSEEVMQAWNKAQTRDDGFRVITEFGRKYGFKNVIAALEGRVPKRYTREKSLTEWVDDRHNEEVNE